jgi:hypothetical protein
MQFVLILHNLLRWAVLFFGLWTLLNGITGYFGKRNYTANDNRSNLFFMICCDIQLLLGLILYFGDGWFNRLKSLHTFFYHGAFNYDVTSMGIGTHWKSFCKKSHRRCY